MKPSDIDTDTFYTAHDLAKQNLPPDRFEAEFTEKLTQFLISEMERARVEAVLEDPSRISGKIKKALDEIQQNRGIDFVTEHRIALLAALEHTLAARMTYSDMPPSIKDSGLYKLDLPDELISKK